MQVPLGAACQHNLGHEGLWQVSQLRGLLLLLLECWWWGIVTPTLLLLKPAG